MYTREDTEFLDYYNTYCEVTIWLKKIILNAQSNQIIKVKDIANDFIMERNRVLLFAPAERRRVLRKKLNKIASAYFAKITNLEDSRKNTVNVV